MAAIAPHIGTQSTEDLDPGVEACRLDADEPPGLGAGGRACIPPVTRTHANLVRTVMIRRLLEKEIRNRKITIELDEKARQYAFRLTPGVGKNAIPWMPAAMDDIRKFTLFGQAAKMACPTWDLPAGAPDVGGACPGATLGQTVVPLAVRLRAKRALALPILSDLRPAETICQLCYATGGNYVSPHVQLGEIVRYWWLRAMLEDRRSAEVIETIVAALSITPIPVEEHDVPGVGKILVRPVRVHSSGDFFNQAYARCWIEVARRLPEVSFWAPTRTWAAKGWVTFWRSGFRRQKGDPFPANFSIRASGYHTDDAAPGLLVEGNAVGTTSIYKSHNTGMRGELQRAWNAGVAKGVAKRVLYAPGGPDDRYDWNCGAYAANDDSHTCTLAVNPNGTKGCRVCWIRPELRVNYTTH